MRELLTSGLLGGLAADAKAQAADASAESPRELFPVLLQLQGSDLPSVCIAGRPDAESPREMARAAGIGDDDVVFVVEVPDPDAPADRGFIRAMFQAESRPVVMPPGSSARRNPFCQWTPGERLDAPGDLQSVSDHRGHLLVPTWGAPGCRPRPWTRTA